MYDAWAIPSGIRYDFAKFIKIKRGYIKMSKKKWAKLTVISLFAFTMLPLPAHAYIDPSAGSYVLQIILAGLFAVPFVIKKYWCKIKDIFKSSK